MDIDGKNRAKRRNRPTLENTGPDIARLLDIEPEETPPPVWPGNDVDWKGGK